MSWITRSICQTAVAAALVGLTSCAELEVESGALEPSLTSNMGKDFGNAVSHNAAQHIIDPVPANALAGAPALDGARAATVYRRYRTGTVTAPESVETTNFGKDR